MTIFHAPDLLTPTWRLTSPSSASYMCKYPRIICTKFKQNWCRNKEIKKHVSNKYFNQSVTYVQPDNRTTRQKKWSHSLSLNVVQARQKLMHVSNKNFNPKVVHMTIFHLTFWPLHDLWPHPPRHHICASTQGSSVPSLNKIDAEIKKLACFKQKL